MTQPYTALESGTTAAAGLLSCFLCGSLDITRLWEGSDKKFQGPGRFTYKQCGACGLVFLHPRPADQEMSRYYPDHVTPVRIGADASFREKTRQYLKRLVAEDWYGYSSGRRPVFKRLSSALRKAVTLPLRPLLRQLPRPRPGGRVLDIGCGSGAYLDFLASLGWTCHGIEPGANSRAYATEVLGLTVHQGPLETCRFPDSFFDVVTMWHVIEHLSDPLRTLYEIRRILKPDGVVMLRTPNVKSWEARLFRGNWYGLDPPRHFFLFAPTTMKSMLERSGFVVTRLHHMYHSVDCTRSLLYVFEDRGSAHAHRFVARWIRAIELGLTACSPLRRVFGQGGAMHVEACKALS
jgi:2-polyprenyl-3-methyl-5-hydroxy-6-metoxy-1,4-benzoquinol methylase